MDIGKSFGFVFEDERWTTKLLIGAGVMIIPIFGSFALMGYAIAIIRNVLAGHPRPLPEWDDLGKNFLDGLLVMVANLIYGLPLWIFSCVVFIPILLPLLGGQNEDLMAVLGGVSVILLSLIGCVYFLLTLVLWLLQPIIFLQYAAHDELGACLRVGEVFRLTVDNIGRIIVAQLVVIVLMSVISLVIGVLTTILSLVPICGTIVALCIALPIGAWMSMFMTHLYGQIGVAAGLGQETVV